jgi:hypothetical protein
MDEHFEEERTMYYHPFMFDWANGERALATCRAWVAVCLEGVARQQHAHAEAVSAFYARQLEGLRALSEARDTAQFAARWLACTGPKPLDVAELSTRLGGILADTHRRLGEVAGSHADEVTRSRFEDANTAEQPRRKASNGSQAGGRRQMAA